MGTNPVRSSSAYPNDDPLPRVWLLMGHKAGDNSQLLALAEALGWPFETKRFVYHRYELITNRLLGCTLAGVVKKASSALEPPWPDLVLTAGRRNEPIARWIQRQAGNRVRLVHLGRPWAAVGRFDLVVTTPQYQLPDSPNVVHNLLPLHRVTETRLVAAAKQWNPRFAHLQRPWFAILIGGNSGPFVFTPEKSARLGREVNALVMETGGSALITDSARTPKGAFRAFQSELDVPNYVYRWQSSAGDNPYFGYLALADSFVVTGESMSMMTEACATGKTLYLFDVSDRHPADKAGCNLGAGERVVHTPWWRARHNFRFKPLSHRLAMRFGPKRMRRNVSAIQEQLVATGRAMWLGQAADDGRQTLPTKDLDRASERVRRLFET